MTRSIFGQSLATGSTDRKAVLILAILATAVLALIPVLETRFVPSNDYPFHLARMMILSQLDNPIFARFYEPGSFFLPNMSMDAIAVPLAKLLGPELATRVFLELTLLTILFGAASLHWAAYRQLSVWPLLAVALLYNGIFRFGFFNYLFGLGAALFAAALWIRMKRGPLRLITALTVSLMLIYLHMEAFGVFAVIVGGVELERAYAARGEQKLWPSLRDLLYSASPFLIAIIVFLLVSPTAGEANRGFEYAPGIGTKPVGALFATSSGIFWLDFMSLASAIGLCAWLAISRNLTISRPLAFATAMMILALFLVPSNILGATYADVRLGPAIALLVIVTLGLRATAPSSAVYAVLAVILALAAVRAVALTTTWAVYNREIASIVDVIDKIEPGSTLFTATADPYPDLIADTPEKRAIWSPSLKHVGSYAVLRSPVFVPMTWAEPTQQPLHVRAPFKGPYQFQGNNPRKVYDAAALPRFITEIQDNLEKGTWRDLGNVYVLVVDTGKVRSEVLPSSVERIADGDRFVLLRLNASGRAANKRGVD